MPGTLHSFPSEGLPVLHMVHITARLQPKLSITWGEGESIRKSLKASTIVPLL